MAAVVTDIREAIGDEKGITLTGSSAISKDINSASQRDLITAEAIGLPIAIIVLLIRFWNSLRFVCPTHDRDCHRCVVIRNFNDSRWTNGSYQFSF